MINSRWIHGWRTLTLYFLSLPLYPLSRSVQTTRIAVVSTGVGVESSITQSFRPFSRRRMINGKWTAFIKRFSNQWPLKTLYNTAYLSPIHSHIHTPTAGSSMQGDRQLVGSRYLLSHMPLQDTWSNTALFCLADEQRDSSLSWIGRGEPVRTRGTCGQHQRNQERNVNMRSPEEQMWRGLKNRETTSLIYEGKRLAVFFFVGLKDDWRMPVCKASSGSHYPRDTRLFIPSQNQRSMDSFRDSPTVEQILQ